MNRKEAFLAQARSDFQVYKLLQARDFPPCQYLHYLQMTTEKVAKAALLEAGADGADRQSHRAFSKLVAVLGRSRYAARQLNMTPQNYRNYLQHVQGIMQKVENLCPGLGTPENVEYPWEGRDSAGDPVWYVPAEYTFDVAEDLRREGYPLLRLIELLINDFDRVMAP